MKEEGKEIKGQEGKYLVSNLGNIKSLNYLHRKKAKNLKPYNSNGYLVVDLYYKGKRKTIPVHRLVAQAFLVNYKKKAEVNHIDGNKINNRLDNLEWCTRKENMHHAILKGLQKSKLTKEDVIEIRKKYKTGNYSYKKLSKEYNVGQMQICRIINNQRWSYV